MVRVSTSRLNSQNHSGGMDMPLEKVDTPPNDSVLILFAEHGSVTTETWREGGRPAARPTDRPEGTDRPTDRLEGPTGGRRTHLTPPDDLVLILFAEHGSVTTETWREGGRPADRLTDQPEGTDRPTDRLEGPTGGIDRSTDPRDLGTDGPRA